jgi:hypothetical protein
MASGLSKTLLEFEDDEIVGEEIAYNPESFEINHEVSTAELLKATTKQNNK